ncbi:MAG: hypothetical protein ACLQBC_10835 [Syntrophales bacterium]
MKVRMGFKDAWDNIFPPDDENWNKFKREHETLAGIFQLLAMVLMAIIGILMLLWLSSVGEW